MSLRGVMHCPCAACGKAERTSGCVRGYTCECTRTGLLGIARGCQRCFCCERHCQCAGGYVTFDVWSAMTTEQKIALVTEGKALRERLQREGKTYR